MKKILAPITSMALCLGLTVGTWVTAGTANAVPPGGGWIYAAWFYYKSDCDTQARRAYVLYKETVCERDSPGYILWVRNPWN